MKDYKDILAELRSKKTGKESIFETHLNTIIELLKNGARVTEILEIIKSMDPLIANKNHMTAYNLLRQYIASARFQSILDFHLPKTNVITRSTTIKSSSIESNTEEKKKEKNKSKKKETEEINLKNGNKSDTAPIAKREGDATVVKTTEEIIADNGEQSQSEALDPIAITMARYNRRKKDN